MAGNVKTLTDANFQETIKSGVTLVDFWATWCPPCQMQGPIVEKLADAFNGSATVGKIDVDENQAAARQFGVANIPTLILFKDGKEVGRMVGLQQEAALTGAINNALK
jgi:thioredoxin